jgi:uncharacterized OB-fold protein
VALDLPVSDAAAVRFFEELRARRLATTRCPQHGWLYPPRLWCPSCLREDLEWAELLGRGTLIAFSTQETAVRFAAPHVIGLVDLDEGVRLLSNIAGSYEELASGARVRVDFVEIDGDVLHRFVVDD